MKNKLLVSVQMITYGHEAFIRQAVESVLMQKTDFEFNLIIADDCSPDKTPIIINDIIKTNPNSYRIKYFRHKENIGMQKNGLFAFSKCTGKYIALCEGDDYWTDPLKLQKQVDFLEENPKYSLCFHNAKIIYENNKRKPCPFVNFDKNIFTIEDVIEKPWFIPTQSIVFKTENVNEYPEWFYHIYNGDLALQLILADKGKLYCINETMSVYRRNNKGLSSINSILYSTQKIIEILYYFNLYSNFKYHKIITKRIQVLNNSLYSKYLNTRPIYVKMLSFDYYNFRAKGLFRKINKFTKQYKNKV